MSPLVGLVVVCAVNPESSPLPFISSSSSIYRHYRDFFKYFPMIPFQDELGLASANFHEIWNVMGQKPLWPVNGWEARAGEALCTASFKAAWSRENRSATILQMLGLLGSLQGVPCLELWKAEPVASPSLLCSLLAVTEASGGGLCSSRLSSGHVRG